ncbi:MAG: mechanosensitive ion channel domain-containing protein [Planctomycetota bacterium]
MTALWNDETVRAGLWTVLALGGGAGAGLLVWRAGLAILARFSRRARGEGGAAWLAVLRGPAALVLPAYGAQLALTVAPLPQPLAGFLGHALALTMIAGVGWLAVALVRAGSRLLAQRFGRQDRAPAARRALETRIHLLQRAATLVVVALVGALVMLTLPYVRELGASILASAGIAGIVAGLAARSVLANLLAGLQLAFTEPIRIGDAVVVKGEYGTIEEIGSSYVVVRIWDLRRLIVPLSHFIEEHFENWTWQSSDLLGTVILYVDYRASVEDLRAELRRIVQRSENWDGQVAILQVTDTTERAVQLRALVSSSEPGRLWNLRCEVREQLLAYLQSASPAGLPQTRAVVSLDGGAGALAGLLAGRGGEVPRR